MEDIRENNEELEEKKIIMRNGVMIKKDGVVTVKNIRPEAIEIASSRCKCVKHICGTCANLDPKKCKKVFDREEQDIREYDFIKNGIEVFNDKGTIVNFIVNKCDCYKPEITREKPKTKEELQRINRLKASIKVGYYDADSIEDANRIERENMERRYFQFFNQSEGIKKVR